MDGGDDCLVLRGYNEPRYPDVNLDRTLSVHFA